MPVVIHFKNDIEEAKDRVNLWWDNKAADRPLIQIFAPREKPIFNIPSKMSHTIHDFWTNPEVVIPRIINKIGSTYFGGEALPIVYPVAGRIVAITSRYLGAPNRYVDENTTWAKPIIDDWDNCPPLEFDAENKWWQITMNLMTAASEALDQYNLECFMGLPDLNGPTEVLSELRGAEKMCMDLILSPYKVMQAAVKVQQAWFKAWERTSAIASKFGGYLTWMGIWSEIPAIDLQSDFSALISPKMFNDYIYPFIKEQIDYFPRTIFHLDGPDMVRHLDTLLSNDDLNSIQWVQGAGAGKVSEWLDVMKKIQAGGKSLYIYCEEDEVKFLCDNLDPKGLMMVVRDCSSEKKAREIMDFLVP